MSGATDGTMENEGFPGERVLKNVFLVVACIATLYPVLWVFKMAFSPVQGFDMSMNPIPSQPTLENFRHFILDTKFRYWLFNSVLVSAATTIFGVFLACTSAYALSRFRFPGRTTAMLAFLVTQMFPGVLTMIPLYIIMDYLGLLGHLGGLILVYSATAIPFCVWMLKGYFDTIPKELEESAIMDGASSAMVFWKIIIPLSLPAIAVTALFSFMTAWNEFIMASTFMTNQSRYTLPVLIQSSVTEHTADYGLFAAGAVVTSIPVMIAFYVLQRYLVGGLTAGAVKG